jgi:DNA-binding NarL/FixJ family response regulator
MSKPYLQIKILIADDHEMVREGLQIMASKIEEIEIIGEASNGEELILLTKKLQPDVVMVDVKMPRYNGIEATKLIKTEFPHIGIIALSSFDEESLVMDMLNAGAKGYLLKNASKQEITEAVKAVYHDQPYYCKDINLKLAQMIAKGGQFPHHRNHDFTEREIEVIKMICQEYSSKQIAAVLHLKTRTIERYRDAIMQKMDVRNAAGVVKFAIKQGIYNPSTEKRPDSPF